MKLIFTFPLVLACFTGEAFSQADAFRDKVEHGVGLYRTGDYAGAIAELTPLAQSKEHGWYRASEYLAASLVHAGKVDDGVKTFQSLIGKSDKAPKDKSKDKPKDKTKDKDADDTAPSDMSKSSKVLSKPEPERVGHLGSWDGVNVWYAVEFKADGKLGMIVLVSTNLKDAVKPTFDAVKKIRFEPAIEHGKPITTVHLIEYSYSSH